MMLQRNMTTNVVGTCVIVLIAAGSLLSPGVRHTHEGGESTHTHSSSSDDLRNSHYPTGIYAGRQIDALPEDQPPKPLESLQAPPQTTTSPAEVASHTHVSFLGFNLTLPDAPDDAEAANEPSHGSKYRSRTREFRTDNHEIRIVQISSPYSLGQTIELFVLVCGPIPSHTKLTNTVHSKTVVQTNIHCAGRIRDAPTPPPPESC